VTSEITSLGVGTSGLLGAFAVSWGDPDCLWRNLDIASTA
jgi:hypothetical protein